MPEGIDVQIARLQEQVKNINQTLAEDRETRKETAQQTNLLLERLSKSVASLDHRLMQVETELTQKAPTFEEYTRLKYQVIGAGRAGRMFWAGLVAVVGFIYAVRNDIKSFLNWIIS